MVESKRRLQLLYVELLLASQCLTWSFSGTLKVPSRKTAKFKPHISTTSEEIEYAINIQYSSVYHILQIAYIIIVDSVVCTSQIKYHYSVRTDTSAMFIQYSGIFL